MSQITAPQIVHESEAQRQHTRLPLPARAIIKGEDYGVRDLSSGGLGVSGITGDFACGNTLDITLRLPFGTFSLDLNLQGEVQHYNPADKLLGCNFVKLTTEQLALINHVLKAFLAGDVVASGDLLNVASRDSFVKARKQSPSIVGAPPVFDIKRQIPGLVVMGVLGLIAAYIIGGNIYDSAFILKSTDAYVSAQILEVNAPAKGTFTLALAPGASTVEAGQVIGEIVDSRAGPSPSIRVVSPCNCQVVRMNVNDGQFVSPETSLMSLTPSDVKPIVVATIEPVSAGRIKTDSKAIITIAGTQKEFSGRVTRMKSGLADESVNTQPGYVPKPVFVTITPDQPLPADLADVPARVVFTTR